jgi:hypothetical protein
MAFHNLTSTKPPKNLRSLLGLSLKFVPNPRYNVSWKVYHSTILPRLVNDLKVKTFMACKIQDADNEDDGYNKRMYVRTGWTPPEHLFPFPKELPRRLQAFTTAIKSLVRRRKCPSNLLPHQRNALEYLQHQKELLVVQCDKNLGPAIIERDEYIKLVFKDHLSDTNTYRRLTEPQAQLHARRIIHTIKEWLRRHTKILTKDEKRFINHHLDANEEPFAAFYATMKVHKPPPLRTRPIVSCSGCLTQAIGVWVDDKLQIAAKAQRSYFKSSFDLKKDLSALAIPPNSSLFIADAVSMYTNIPTDRALLFIGTYLRQKRFPGIPVQALMEALSLVMKNNIFTFGNTTWKQLTGTAMGTPPAPPWATLYFALCEETVIPQFEDNLTLYRRFIDDILGVWTVTDASTDQQTWESFQAAINSPIYKLEWEFSPLSNQVDFMDLTIRIDDDRLHTSLYEKPSNLHLYIPPHSCHPPGLVRGIVLGMIYRIHSLCSDKDDVRNRTVELYQQLIHRGYSRNILVPLFKEAIARATTPTNPTAAAAAAEVTEEQTATLRRSLFFHLKYHPLNPASSAIQRAWQNTIANPPHSRPLAEVRNHAGTPIGIERLIIAYQRPFNLGNLLSYRKLKDNSGPPVSSYIIRATRDV